MLSDSGEIPKVKGTRKVGGAGKEKKWDKATPPLPSLILSVLFSVRAFSIQRARLSRSQEEAKL